MSTISVMTFAEFEKLPDFEGKRELLHGEVIEMPPARSTHMAVVMEFVRFFILHQPQLRLWVESGYRIGDGWLIPDLSFTESDPEMVDGYIVGPPVIAVEVASPSNTAPALEAKTAAYLTAGASEVWVVYPESGRMWVHQGDHARFYTGSYHCELLNLDVPVEQLLKKSPSSEPQGR